MLRNQLQKLVSSRGKSRKNSRRLRLENLEHRQLLAADPGWALSFGSQDESTLALGTLLDAAGNAYVTGRFQGTVDFDQAATHPGDTDILSSLGDYDGFVAKYSSAGDFLWARRMGGAGYDIASALAVDSLGHAYVVGRFTDAGDFDNDVDHTLEVISNGGEDVFVMQLDATTGATQWTRSFGGTTPIWDFGQGVATASDGSVFVSGFVYDTSGQVDLDPGAGVAMTGNGTFVLKLDSAGNYLTSWGGIPSQYYQGTASVAVDDSGVYLSSVYVGSVDFDPGDGQTIRQSWYTDSDDIFVAKYSQQGKFDWVQTLGGAAQHYNQEAKRIVLDAGRVYVAGSFTGGLDLDGDRVIGNNDLTGSGTDGGFVASFAKPDGSLNWAQSLGTNAIGLAVDGAGSLFIAGVDTNAVDSTTEAFLSKLDAANGDPLSIWDLGPTAPNGFLATDVAIDSAGLVYLSGIMRGTASLPNGLTLTAVGSADALLLQFNPTAPRVTITSPTSSQTLVEGATVNFAGTAIDDQDGNLTSSLVWKSESITLGTGGSVGPVALGVGVHVITAQATDSDGLVSSSSVSVSVNPKAPTSLTGSVSGSQVTLHWLDKSAGETGYQVERAAKPSGKNGTPQWSVVDTLPANATNYSDSPGSGNWLYRVQATAVGVASAYSNQLSISIAKGGKKTASANSTLTVSAKTTAVTTSDLTAPDLVTVSSDVGSNPSSTPEQPLMPTKPATKSKLVDAAMQQADDSWLDVPLQDDLLADLAAAQA